MRHCQYLAHVKKSDETWQVHDLSDHLKDVGQLASNMAVDFNGEEWAKLAGLWHDLGKYRPAFQAYIKTSSGYDVDAHIEQVFGRVDHSTAGALHAVESLNASGRLLAYIIAGHHAGLPDWSSAYTGSSALEVRLENARTKKYREEALLANIPSDILVLEPTITKRPSGGINGLHLWLRMLFSTLVDADFLDTERFMDPKKFVQRGFIGKIAELSVQFDTYIENKSRNCKQTPVNQWRDLVLQDCRKAAMELPGIYTLTVPTGGGKTLSINEFSCSL